jgi:hypothetical protein
MRVTEKTRIDMPRARIAELRTRSGKYNEQIVSGRRVNKPSDDPLGALRIGVLETQKTKVEQFDRNLDRGRAFLGHRARVRRSGDRTPSVHRHVGVELLRPGHDPALQV